MSPGTAYAIWIAVRALMALFGAFAIYSIVRDVRAAWPRIVELFTEEEPEDDDA